MKGIGCWLLIVLRMIGRKEIVIWLRNYQIQKEKEKKKK